MPIYEYQGQQYESSETDPKVAKEKILKYLGKSSKEEKEEAPAPAPQAEGETGLGAFVPSVQRGYYGLKSLLGDVAPAMAGRIGEKLGIQGAKEYADKQMQEAAEAQAEIERKYPTAVGSFTNIKSAGDFGTYVVEAVGELIPSMLPSLFTGGASTIIGRGAIAAAKKAAEEAVVKGAAAGMAKSEVAELAKKAGIEAARKTALKYEAAGALTGSAAQNIPETYQNIAQETGKENLGAALVAGGFNAVLDAITPIKLLHTARGVDLGNNEIIGAWYKRIAKGLGEGFLTEGATEAVQEMSSAAAEKFVDNNKDFFTKDNFIRFLDAGLKGGIGGGVATGATAGVFGRKEAPKTVGEEAKKAIEEAAPEVAATAPTTPETQLTTEQALAELDKVMQPTPKKEVKDEGTRIDTGVSEPSVSAPRAEDTVSRTEAGTAGTEPGSMGGAERTAEVTPRGAEEQRGALEGFHDWLKSKGISPTDVKSDEEFYKLNQQFEYEKQKKKDSATVRELALEEQRKAGWNPDWPFVPADLGNSDFRELIKSDPSISSEEKTKIFDAGKKLGVIAKDETIEAKPAPRTVQEEIVAKQDTRKKQTKAKAEVEAEPKLTSAQKQTQIVSSHYAIASQNTPRGATNPLDILAGDLYMDAKKDEFLPGTGGVYAQQYYASLNTEDKAYVDEKVKWLKEHHEGKKGWRGAKDVRTKQSLETEARKGVQEAHAAARTEQAGEIKSDIAAAEKVITKKLSKQIDAAYKRIVGKDAPKVRRELQGKTTERLIGLVFRGDTRAALKEIATSKEFSPLDKQIAERLLQSKTLPHIEIVDPGRIKDGDGQYVSFTDTVQIAEGQVDSHTVLHEVTHGFLHNLIRKFKAGEIQNKALTDLKNLFDTLHAEHPELAINEATKYGMGSLTEFASEMMSNPEFQLAMNEIPYQRVNAFVEFAKAVLRLLGINPNEKSTALAAGLIFNERALAVGREYQVREITGKETAAPALLVKQAEEYKKGIDSVDSWIQSMPDAAPPPTTSQIKKAFTTAQGVKELARLFQNERYPIKNWEDMLERAKLIKYGTDDANDIYNQITLGVGRAEDFFHTHIANPSAALYDAIGDYAKARKLSIDNALKELQAIFISLHEPERRRVKYLMNVPLTADAAQQRQKILELVRSNKVNEETAKVLRGRLEELVRNNVPAEGAIGYSYDETGMLIDEPVKAPAINEQSIIYNVAGGIDPKVFTDARALAAKPENAVFVKHIREALQEVHKATVDLNKRANYWSQPVSNIVAFYGFDNYIPLKGRPGEKQSYADAILNFDSEINGKELQEVAYQFGGRMSESDNPLLQSLSDGVRSAMRAGRGGTLYNADGKPVINKDGKPAQFGLTLAIKNAINQKLLDGSPVAHIKFEDRYKFGAQMLKEKGENVFFHYNPDGSIDIYSIQNNSLREAIRRTYERTQPLTDALNKITSGLGQLHTRYNVAFAPMNFFRDMLTNAFTIGAEKGTGKSAQYIGTVASKVLTQNGLGKAMKVARLYEKGEFNKIEELGKKDPYIQAMYEYIVEGGKVSYLKGLAIQSQFEKMQKDIGRSKIARSKEQIDGVIDLWVDMFELASRTSGYQLMRDQYIQEGMGPKEARVKAAGYVKNLANFEQVGKYGRAAGAFFMFFRPSATGAVRAIEAIAPLFRNVDAAWEMLPEHAKKIPGAKEAFYESMHKQKRAAAHMMIALAGMGSAIYLMALSMAGDDDDGRNEVATDDMTRWSRYARFHIPGTEIVFQIPWGFGLGSFAAAGAQLTAFGIGNNSLKDTLINTMLVGMDSFLPLPVSRINPLDNPAAWAMDTATPSMFRPFFEYAMNLDGLGREIYNNRQSRVGDAYTGGDNIPEAYKDAAILLANVTDGFLNWSPNTMYFFANNYADGISRLVHNSYDLGLVAAGEKDYNPKTGTIAFDSFFGAKSNYDARQFSSVENQIKEMERTLNTFKNDPEKFADYISKYPYEPAIVEIYNKSKGQLNKINQLANQYRVMPGLTAKERKDMLDNIKQQQNLFKRNLIEVFEAYDVKP